MATTTGRKNQQREYSGGAVTVTATAGILMLLMGFFHVVQGLVGLVNSDDFYVVTREYVFDLDLTTWGWLHVIIGVLVAAAGVGLFQGAVWARTVAVVVACISIVANFMWLPYYPLWSLTVMVFGVLVIWAVTAHGRDITQP